ncbi:MAG: agmatine deiminase family protein [Bacilli bacterium]|nr:agmatine deiminase family protein [Bacilli bacterium]
MKTFKTISVVSILTAVALVSCHPAISSFDASSSNEPSLVSSTINVSSGENSSSINVISSSSSEVSSSSKEASSSKQSSQSSMASNSSSAFSSSSSASSSSSSSSVSSSSASSSQAPSSSSSVSSSISSSSSSISSSVSSSSSSTSSTQSSQSSSSSSSSSSSTPIEPVDPLVNYETIDTFSMRMPAEFEPASMVKMCYPINMPLSVYKSIAETNKILLLVNPDDSNKSRITKARSELVGGGVNVDNVTFIDMPIDSDYAYWVRDFSPFYVFKEKQLTITDFTYNRPRYEQNAVPSALAEYFDIPYNKMYLTHTGGNLMQDGRGTAFSDDLVIQENSYNRSKVMTQMKRYTGTDNYVITIDPQGDYIAHIDCWGKIVAPDKIIVARLPETNSRYQYYEQVANQLANTKCVYGYNYRIYRVDEKGGNVIAPYTNSLIANNHVYLPLGSDATDNQNAIKVYQEALPGYEVIGLKGFSSNDAYGRQFLNTDALHCRTHEVPDQNMVFIDSREVYHGEVDLKEHYVIKTNVVSYANEELDNVTIHYSINDSQYIEKPMNQYLETTNYTFVFEGLESGDEVKYYIDAKDAKDNYNIDPTCGALDPHHFIIK